MQRDSYILVTPCKNEEENLSNLICSINAQTVKPTLWVIVDDGSTDKTGEMISCAEKEHNWIKGIYLSKYDEQVHNYGFACSRGFDFAIEFCQKSSTDYYYIGLVDADNIPEQTYFEKLINEFERDPKLGIASGINAYADIQSLLSKLKKNDPTVNVMSEEFWNLYGTSSVQIQKAHEDRPMGSARLWRKESFRGTCDGYYKGYGLGFGPDSISTVKAKMQGWRTKRFKDARIIERQGAVREGLWKEGFRGGKCDYFLGRPLYFSVARGIKFMIKRHPLFGMARVYGYTHSIIKRDEKIADLEIREYYQKIRANELKEYYIKKFSSRLRK